MESHLAKCPKCKKNIKIATKYNASKNLDGYTGFCQLCGEFYCYFINKKNGKLHTNVGKILKRKSLFSVIEK
jgi:hypothetical protein